ncbi:hypothetical protein FNH09_37585 [Streptomyces adustus]|uniref:Competence protein CoiA nuclease-like domain-containing protein n=1 Tax=Streptomyces adustus TaxID=1609272 RepID=A0A5N8VN99_9ACTN|nr:hypothetical protein [Streptomyces adustus]MPY36730.1 hypothetical protein [Streptomyces adustus]
MSNGVFHSGLQRILNLDREDLGLGSNWPGLPELRDSLLVPVAQRDRELLVCAQKSLGRPCKAEQSGVKSPHMYVRRHRGPDGVQRLRAAHLPTPHEMTPEESDRHKAMKDFLARTGQGAGLEVYVEKTTKNRTSRPDVTIVGAGGLSLACEAQYYNASADTVLRRSKNHAAAGLAANWITHDDRFHLIDRANWMLTRSMTWREISSAADLALIGGFRILVEWLCTASAERPCPDARIKTGCGKTHLQWDTPRRQDDEGTGWTGHTGNTRGVTVGQTLIGAATGSVASLFAASRKDRRSGAYMWVPAQHRDRWADYQNDEEPGNEEQQPAEEAIHFSGRDVDTTCNFGDDTFVPSAQLERRGLYGVELTRTVDRPAPRRSGLPVEEDSAAVPPRINGSPHRVDAPLVPRQPLIPSQPSAPAAETEAPATSLADAPSCAPTTRSDEPALSGLPTPLIALQHAANLERIKLEHLDSPDERAQQRRIWLEAATAIQNAVTHYATTENLNRFDVEQQLRRAVKTYGMDK